MFDVTTFRVAILPTRAETTLAFVKRIFDCRTLIDVMFAVSPEKLVTFEFRTFEVVTFSYATFDIRDVRVVTFAVNTLADVIFITPA